MRFLWVSVVRQADWARPVGEGEQIHCAGEREAEADPGDPQWRPEKVHKRGKAAAATGGLRFARPEEPAQQPAQVVRRGRDRVTFPHVDQAAQPTPPRPAGVADVREGTLADLAPPPLQRLALGPPDPTTV